jgi:chromatin remodeling complex protein RSC6
VPFACDIHSGFEGHCTQRSAEGWLCGLGRRGKSKRELIHAAHMQESTKQTGRKPNAALAKPVQPDEKLAAVVGSDPLPRTVITKRLWDYIKEHGLQDAKNKQRINADEKLKAVFDGRDQVSMFEMTKLVSGHMK